MTLFKASCEWCGEFEVPLTSKDVSLYVNTTVPGESIYSFVCPLCSGCNRKHANERLIRLLKFGGVIPIETKHPEQLPPDNRGPITWDEIMEFHEIMETQPRYEYWIMRLFAGADS